MATRSKRRRRSPKVETLEASSTLVGPSFSMPDRTLEAMAMDAQAPIDFQARQDAISPTRRDPGATLAPKLKQTTAKPSKAKETRIKL